jgi:hypothetical protein
MPTPTYDLIATTTLAAATSSVVFGPIPQNYRDLILVYSGSGSAATAVNATINSDAGNGSTVYMFGNSSGKSSAVDNTIKTIGTIDTGLSNNIVQFIDYSVTDKHKTILTRSNRGTGSFVGAYAVRWASTTAITSIDVVPGSGTLSSGMTLSLYGVIA